MRTGRVPSPHTSAAQAEGLMQPDEAKGLDFSVLSLHFICWKLIFKVMKTIGQKIKICEPSQALPVGHQSSESFSGEGISVTRKLHQ